MDECYLLYIQRPLNWNSALFVLFLDRTALGFFYRQGLRNTNLWLVFDTTWRRCSLPTALRKWIGCVNKMQTITVYAIRLRKFMVFFVPMQIFCATDWCYLLFFHDLCREDSCMLKRSKRCTVFNKKCTISYLLMRWSRFILFFSSI